ncbi:MAG: SDR family oxidoreductase [Prevotella sp.]|jgi:NAD(P)-dependent dehydrogenase (short-subunit alcohol dehydrogenase family)
MTFDYNENKQVAVLLGAGSMGTSILERVASGMKILLGDISQKSLDHASEHFRYAGYDVETMIVDACSKDSIEQFAQKAASLGEVKYFIDTAGASPNQAKPEFILRLDMVGTAYALDSFGKVMARGGAGLVISSQVHEMYPRPLTFEEEKALTTYPADELMNLPISKEAMVNSGSAYVIAKKANVLRVRKAAVEWGKRGARINTVSPGIIVTPLAYDEFNANGDAYQKMIESTPARRVGNPSEVANAAEFLLSDKASFITGTDLLIDGGTIAAIKTGTYQVQLQ